MKNSLHSRLVQAACILLFLATSPIFVKAQNKLTPELLWQLGSVSDAQLSPDGKTVIYGVRTSDLAANKRTNIIYSIPSAGGNPVALTAKEDNAFNARWRPDGKKIGFLKASDDGVQLFEMNPDGSGKTQVTHVADGIDLFIYSPKMNYLLYAKEVQVDKTVKDIYPDLDKATGRIYDGLNMRHWDTWNTGAYTHLFYIKYSDGKTEGEGVDVLKGQPYDSPVKPFGGDEQIAWSPNGQSFVYTCKKLVGTAYALSTNSDLFLYDISSGKERNLTPHNPGYDNDPQFSPDGALIAYHSMAGAGYESDKNRIMILNYSRSDSAIDATAGFDNTTEAFTWSADRKTIYFLSPINATVQVFSYTLSAGKNAKQINQITDGWHDYTTIQAGMNGKKTVLVGGLMSMNAPVELYTIDPVKKTETQLTKTNNELLSTIKMGKIEKRMVKADDGKEIFTWVIYPPDFNPSQKYPALLYCQGGPQSTVSQFFSSRWNFQLMAANGYIVVAPNRRGLPSFGQEWNDAIVGDYGGKPMTDYLNAIDNVSKEPYVNKDKLGCVGASYGGYSVYWLAGNHQGRFKVFIAHCGMFNMESWYGSTEEMFFANHDQNGSYWKNKANYDKFSPHNFVQNWNTPILIIHNEKDFRVPLTQGMEAFTAAQTMGIPSRFLYFPDENHWVSKPQNSVLWHRVFYDWLDRYLK
jgi:dipeptidyl aminopeptidase/acylaminoacyl peptidase